MAKKDELLKKVGELGLTAEEIDGKTNAELEALIESKETENAELNKISDEAQAKIKEKTPPEKPAQKMYSAEDVKKMFNEFKKEMNSSEAPDDEDEGPRKHTVRMSRLQGKFVIGMVNMNKDEFFPNRIIYSQDVFNEQTKQFVPHSEFILKGENGEPDSTLTLPIETAFKVANKVVCELVERKYKDASEKYGQIEVQEMKPEQFGMVGTGNYIQGKANIKLESYVVKLPTGELVEVIRDVINW